MSVRLIFAPALLALLALLTLLGACASSPVQQRADLLGTAIPASAAAHIVVITPATRWVKVTGGDTVRFTGGDWRPPPR